MNGKIGLAVAVEVERSQRDTACDRFFENSCGYRITIAQDDPRKTNINGDELHVSFHRDTLSTGIDWGFTTSE
jgi:hypothetical protein